MSKRTSWHGVLGVVFLGVVLVLTGGCKHKPEQPISPGLTPQAGTGGVEKTTGGEGLPEFEIEKILFDRNSPDGLKPVYFDYDSYALRPDSLQTLAENADKIKKVPGVMIQIEGHCDERGTQEYNLALGEKRALATREHLMKLGISGDRMVTISYGKEQPAEQGHDEGAWKLNRRCEFNKAI